jgi:hypothetical protein
MYCNFSAKDNREAEKKTTNTKNIAKGHMLQRHDKKQSKQPATKQRTQ